MTSKERIDLNLLLPHVTDDSDACVGRLEEILRAKRGVTRVHTNGRDDGVAAHICIHFDPSQVSLAEVQELAGRAGLTIENKFGHFIDRKSPMDARLADLRSSQLLQLAGVLEAVVAADGTIRVEFDKNLTTYDTIASHIESWRTDSRPKLSKPREREREREHEHEHEHEHSHEHAHEHPSHHSHRHHEDHTAGHHHHHHHRMVGGLDIELICAILAGISLATGWTLSYLVTSAWLPTVFYAGSYALTGWFLLLEAWERVRVGKFEIDSLMLLAALGAAYLGKWAEGGLLLFLFSIGHALESYAMGRAKRAIEALNELAPPTALVQRNGQWIEVAVEELIVGEHITVKPNERLAADGFVISGTSSVNQAPVTGESVPADKRPVPDFQLARLHPDQLPNEHRVYAGTINGSGALVVQVTKSAADNTLSRVIKLVSEAETRVSPTQTFTHRIETYFVPAVLIFDCLLLFAPLVINEPFSSSLYRAMAVLVAASPCALAIATPSAVLSGIARAARGGVLIKGGGPLESLGAIKLMAFDKTGTLTEGKPRLTDVIPMPSIARDRLLRMAASVEQLSDHPLAAAVVHGAHTELNGIELLPAENMNNIVGRGITAVIEGEILTIGNASLFESNSETLSQEIQSIADRLSSQGRTTMIVRHGSVELGVLGVMDTPRASAAAVIKKLKQLGVQRMVMLSGDSQRVASAVASSIGIEEAQGGLLPEDKVNAIQKLSATGPVAMVGDGVNDAPAMAGAAVGIVMGAAGSDVALETADVALMADNLNHLPFAVGLSRRTRAIIRQNLWISLGMVAFLVPATALGLSLGPAVVLHEGSTLVVVLNALRLLAYDYREGGAAE